MSLSVCNGSMDDLKQLIQETKGFEKKITVFDFDFSKMNEREKLKKLIQIMYCGHYKEVSSKKEVAESIWNVFSSRQYMMEKFEANKEFIIKFMTRLHEVQAQNCFGFSKCPSKSGATGVDAGDCMCPGLSLLSHSCAPNVLRVCVDKKFALVVTRKIEKGEQIFCNYM